MTFELGRAELILQLQGDQLLRDQAKAFDATVKKAQDASKQIAEAIKVQERSVAKAAEVIISESNKAEKARLAAEKAAANERKKTTQEWLKFNQKAYQDDLRNWQATLKARDAANKAEMQSWRQLLKERDAAVKEQQRAQLEYERTIKRLDKERDDQARKELNRIHKEIQETKRLNEERSKPVRRSADSTFSAGGFFGGTFRGIGGDIATIAGFGAIASGAVLVREAIQKVTEATLNQEQAQRSLNAAFGDTAGIYRKQAEQLAEQFNLVNSTVEQATARFGVLQNQTVITSDVIDKLTKVAINNAAAFGGTLEEAHRSLAGAVLGETEAYEKYGVVLQEGVLKASSKLTEDERRRWTIMSESEKQLIRVRIILEESTKVQGAAAAKAKETAGGFDALNRSSDELAKTIGSRTIPAISELAREIAKVNTATVAFLTEYDKVNNAVNQTTALQQRREQIRQALPFGGGPLGPLVVTGISAAESPEAIRAIREREIKHEQYQLDVANYARHFEDKQKLEQANRDRIDADLKARRELLERALKDANEAELKDIERQKKAFEYERQLRLEALEQRKNAELKNLEEVEEARRKASELELARIQKEKDEALRNIEDRKREELRRLDTVNDARKAAVEEQLRQLDIEKEQRKRAAEDLRDSEIKAAEEARDKAIAAATQTRDATLKRLEQEQEAREAARIKEDNDIADSITRRERLLDDNHRKVLRQLEREAEKARDKDNRDDDAKEKRAKADEKRYRDRIRQIDDEAQRRIDAIDEELRKFEDAERARDAARRRRQFNQQISDAQLDLRRATGTQDPLARAAAQSKLVSAIRIGDPEAIKRAQDQLTEIVGQGTEAIAEAQRNLSNLQEDFRDNDIRDAEDAQKQKLQDEKERIDRTRDEEKRAEQDRDRERKERLDKDKKSDEDRSRSALQAIERKREKEEDAHRQAKRDLDDLTETNKRSLEERRRNEDIHHERLVEGTRETYTQVTTETKNSYEQTTDAARERYQEEQRLIHDTYDSEATGSIPAVKRASKEAEIAYQGQKTAAEDRYRAEQEAVRNLYDDPVNGIIEQHRRGEADQRTAYQRMVAATREEYENMRKEVEKAYVTGDGKSGILEKLDVLKEKTQTDLDEILTKFDLHAKGLVGEGGYVKVMWETATFQASEYFKYVDAELSRRRNFTPPARQVPSIQQGPDPGLPGSTDPGGGPAGSNPPTFTPDPAPGIGSEPVSPTGREQVNVNPNRFTTTFGFLQRYTNPFNRRIPRHRGVDMVIDGADYGGFGLPVGAFRGGKVAYITRDPNGGNGVSIRASDGLYDRYFHLNEINVNEGDIVNRGDRIGTLGESGTKGSPHLHYEVVRNGASGDYEDQGIPLIDPRPYMNGRDEGHTFKNPTAYQDLRTGERGLIAERRPEILLGSRDTQYLMSMGVNKSLAYPTNRMVDYGAIGEQNLSTPVIQETQIREGDKFNYYGVAPENIFRQFNDHKRRQRVLRGE